MEAIECDAFTVLVNRKLISKATKGKNWTPVFPDQERAASPGEEEADAGNPQDVQICSRARKTAASRYPRESAFEVTVYDTERMNHRVLFSKYKTHQFPRKKEDLWAPLLPLLVIFAGYGNDEPLLQRLSHFALDREFALDLAPKDLAPHASGTALLNELHEGLLELQRSLESGDPQQMSNALETMPSELRTKDCLVLEAKCLELGEAEERIERAIRSVEQGFITSGLDNLQRALKFAEQMSLSGEVVLKGKALLASYTEEDEFEADEMPEPGSAGGPAVNRRSFSRARLSIRSSKSSDVNRRQSASMDSMLMETRAKVLTEIHKKLYEATKTWPFKVHVPGHRTDGGTSMTDIEDFLSKVHKCLVHHNQERNQLTEQQKSENAAKALEIEKLHEALEDLQKQLAEQDRIEDVQPPQRVMPGEFGAMSGNPTESDPLVCFDCANALCKSQTPDISPEELSELRLQTKLLTERCRDLKAQLKAAKSGPPSRSASSMSKR
jgi:hypothetical protein